jgi:hypothetical protein
MSSITNHTNRILGYRLKYRNSSVYFSMVDRCGVPEESFAMAHDVSLMVQGVSTFRQIAAPFLSRVLDARKFDENRCWKLELSVLIYVPLYLPPSQ